MSENEQAAVRLGRALQQIWDESVDAEFQVGAAQALGVLAELAEAGPGSTWHDVARALVSPPDMAACGVRNPDTNERCLLTMEEHGRGHAWHLRDSQHAATTPTTAETP